MYRRDVTANLAWFGYSLLAATVVGLFVPLWGGDLGRRLMLIVPGIVLALVILASARAGAPRPAAVAAVGGAWVMLTVATWTGGGVMSVAYLAYLIPILAAGVLLGRRAATLVFGVSLVSGLLMAVAEIQGWLPADVVASSPLLRWSSRSIVLGLALAILYGADLSMERAFAAVRQEVEERKRAEIAARDAAQRLHVAMEAAGLAAWEWDIEHDLITWSAEAATLVGRPVSDLSSTIRQAIAKVHPDDRESFQRTAERLRRTPEPGMIRFGQRVVEPDGTVRWFEELGRYFPATDNRPPRIVGVISDISERRRVDELQLAVARGLSTEVGAGFFRSLVGHLADGLGVDIAFVGQLVEDGTLVRTIGASENGTLAPDFDYALRGTPCQQVVSGGLCTYPAGVQQQFPEDRGLVTKGIEGYAGQPLVDSTGRPMGLLVVMSRRPLQNLAELESILRIFAIRAATELERMHAMKAQAALETQLRQSQKMETIGQLAGGVAHDFNNLLSPILGYADLLLGDLRPDDHRRDYLQTIKDAAERAAALTRQLLTFSRRQLIDITVFPLNDAVVGFEKILRRTIREDIVLRFQYTGAPTSIRGDLSQIEQVLMNLVVNAQDAMPSGGEIVVETGEATGARPEAAHPDDATPVVRLITLSVTDTGTGMSPDVLQHVFEPFYTTKEKGRGTGLGLATVYGIVQQHRGRVEIDSRPGVGTRVAICLPAAEPAAAVEAGAPAAEASVAAATETVVVVEDDEIVRELVRVVLRQRGYDVIAFSDPVHCLEARSDAACHADLLLTDIIMPGLNGRQLYEQLRVRCPSLKVLYMSGYADSVIAECAVGGGGIALLPKPFTVDALATRVRQAIDAPPPAEPRPELPPGGARLLKG